MSTIPPSDRPDAGVGAPGTAWPDPAPQPARVPEGRLQPPPVGADGPGPWAQPAPAEGPAAWSPPRPGYADPGYAPAPDPAYQPTTAWGAGGDSRYRAPRVRRTGPSWATVAPALFASLMISVGIIVLFFGNLFVALGAPTGTSGRDRLLELLAPADLAAAAALVLAVALVVLQRTRPDAAVAGPRGGRVRSVALLAGGVAALVAVAALLRAIVLVTVPHTPGAVKIGDFIAGLAIVLVAGAAAAWSLRTRW